jgi:osmotically-inducible protein OsmY
MKKALSFTAILLVLIYSLLSFSGCATLVTEAAKKALEDRTTEDQVLDAKIASSIINQLSAKDKGLLLDVGVDVWEQRVLLTGTLDSAQVHSDVIAIVKSDSRISQLYEHVQIVTTEEKEARRKQKEESGESGGAGDTVSDIWIETKIQAQLLTAQNVTSLNYRWRSVQGKIYIIGRSNDSLERDYTLEIIRTTKGVQSVTHYIEIKAVS